MSKDSLYDGDDLFDYEEVKKKSSSKAEPRIDSDEDEELDEAYKQRVFNPSSSKKKRIRVESDNESDSDDDEEEEPSRKKKWTKKTKKYSKVKKFVIFASWKNFLGLFRFIRRPQAILAAQPHPIRSNYSHVPEMQRKNVRS